MVFDDDVTVTRRRDVLWRATPGHLVVALLDDEVFEATGSAPAIWQAIDRPTVVGELIQSLAEAHAVAPEHIRDDVVTFLAELVAARLVTTDG